MLDFRQTIFQLLCMTILDRADYWKYKIFRVFEIKGGKGDG
jgi:hypothetical protein